MNNKINEPSNTLQRNPNVKFVIPKILIVCEGKTEVLYFENLKKILQWDNISIKSRKASGSAPISVVETAINEQKEQIDNNGDFNKYDNIFCIIDQDRHPSHKDSLVLIKRYNKASDVHITRVYSNPCFEYWLLLHVTNTTAPFTAIGRKSVGDVCKGVLKNSNPIFKTYDKAKSIEQLMKFLISNMDDAIKNAINSLREANIRGDQNPITEIGGLILYLTLVNERVIEPSNKLMLDLNMVQNIIRIGLSKR